MATYQIAVVGGDPSIPILTNVSTFKLAMRSIRNRFDMLHIPRDRQYVIIHNGIVMRRVKRNISTTAGIRRGLK